MIYLSSFMLSNHQVRNPNIYPYNVFRGKDIAPFVFRDITVLYGNNGSGKSTILNVIANKLGIRGKEYATGNSFGLVDYCGKFSGECIYNLADDEKTGHTFSGIPADSRYIKSEDILYEIKKVQQKQVLGDGMLYDQIQSGKGVLEAKKFLASKEGANLQDNIEFSQEKYSNGETAVQYFTDSIKPEALYLLDEPEVSLSPENQVKLAEELNEMARFFDCQFIIATHSPFLLGTLCAKIYNLDTKDYRTAEWYELENVKYFYHFFKKHEEKF